MKVKHYICELKASGAKIVSEFKQIQFNFGGAGGAIVDEEGVEMKYALMAIDRWNAAYADNPYKYYLPIVPVEEAIPERPDLMAKPVSKDNQVWRYEPATKTIRSVPENYWIASMNSWDKAVDHQANAKLIAAAPELLYALKILFGSYKALVDSGDAGDWRLETTSEGILAIKAMAKAEFGEID